MPNDDDIARGVWEWELWFFRVKGVAGRGGSIRDLATLPTYQGLSEIETARIAILAKSTNALMTGRIQAQDQSVPARQSGLQRTAGP
jgi:hypothetical protein